jgi:PhnB protein
MPKKARPIPKGFATVTPSLTQESSAQTIEFCKKAFGAKVRMNMTGPNGKCMHAEIQIGDSILMMNDVMQEPVQPAGLFLYVPDVDKTFAKALKAGATALMPPTDMFWGDRFGRVQDPSGNRWGIATHIEDVTPREMKKRAAAAFAPAAGGPGS